MDILYEDNHLLAVVKPAGVLSQGDKTGDLDILTLGKEYIKHTYNKPGNVYLGLVHRLDRPVSGVMVFARTSKAAARLVNVFKKRQVEKKYVAIIEGRCTGSGACDDWLVKEKGHVRVVGASHPKAKRAQLTWRCLATTSSYSLLDVDLHTGRPHQVRVQLANLGFPILGDLRYGAREEFDGRNLALHAYRLAFEHPVRREPVVLLAHTPETWSGYFDEQLAAAIQQAAV